MRGEMQKTVLPGFLFPGVFGGLCAGQNFAVRAEYAP
jgi:hypothetical protein